MSLRQTPKRNFMPGSLFYYIYRLKALFKKILRYKCFPVNFVKFLNHLFIEHLQTGVSGSLLPRPYVFESCWICSPVSCEFIQNFAVFTGKHLCWGLFLNKKLWHRCFPVNSVKPLRNLSWSLCWILPYWFEKS